jgi:hypothetical protein
MREAKDTYFANTILTAYYIHIKLNIFSTNIFIIFLSSAII